MFIKNGFKHYRKRYSLTEVRIGMLILIGLGAIAGWVAYKGARPDPELFSAAPGQTNRGRALDDQPMPEGVFAGSAAAPPAEARGPVPAGIAPEAWVERKLQRFGPDNVYEKIDGREGYYKSFGFVAMYFVALEKADDPTVSIDIEIYDQGSAKNALGAYAGELQSEAKPKIEDGGLVHYTRNAMFMTRGRYYIRSIGSDETEAIKSALQALEKSLREAIQSEALPWAYELFVKLGYDPAKIAYFSENAFSFGFARDVYSVLLPDEETELFVVATKSEAEADALADQFNEGFLQYGEAAGGKHEVPWVKDRYLGRVSGAASSGRFVAGVRGAEGSEAAAAALDALETGLATIRPEAIDAPPAPESPEPTTEH